ncbi:phosphate uptake regulator PhoU [Sulfolobus acidocaldarius SUSAZ]|nr:phosphate uptake regulator PhoU [Sulfolobus acidocaldarius SUSAZ]
MSKPIVRRIQLTGGSTYIISLPKGWVKQHSLKPGDEVEITEDRQMRLILIPRAGNDTDKKERSITMNCEGADISFLVREIIAYYMAGYSLVDVYCNKFNTMEKEKIKELVRNRLLGAEVIDESSNNISIQFLVNEKDLSITKSLGRAFNISYNMFRDALNGLQKGDKELSKEIRNRDDDVDRFFFYTIRQLSLSVEYPDILDEEKFNLTQLTDISSIAKSIERVSDHAIRIAEQTQSIERLNNETVYNHGMSVIELYKTSFSAFSNRDRKRAHDVINKGFETLDTNSKLSENVIMNFHSLKDDSSTLIVLDSIRRVTRYSMDIAEATIDLLAKQTE